MNIKEKFEGLGIDNAPGQEALQKNQPLELRGEKLAGAPVDFSHGDVDAQTFKFFLDVHKPVSFRPQRGPYFSMVKLYQKKTVCATIFTAAEGAHSHGMSPFSFSQVRNTRFLGMLDWVSI